MPDLGGIRDQQLIILDNKKPENMPEMARFYKVDLMQPTADAMVADILQRERADTVVHLAFRSNPSRRSADAHELEVIGTLNLLNASAAAAVKHVVVRSTTMAYGAHPLNPNYLTEDHPLRAAKKLQVCAGQSRGGSAGTALCQAVQGNHNDVAAVCSHLGADSQQLCHSLFAASRITDVVGI